MAYPGIIIQCSVCLQVVVVIWLCSDIRTLVTFYYMLVNSDTWPNKLSELEHEAAQTGVGSLTHRCTRRANLCGHGQMTWPQSASRRKEWHSDGTLQTLYPENPGKNPHKLESTE